MPAQGHILDANTAALYRMDMLSEGTKYTIADKAAGGRHATASAESKTAAVRPIGPNEEFVRFFGATTEHDAAGDATVAAALIGQHTFECFVYVTSLAAQLNIVAYSASGETLATNYLTQWYIATTGRMGVFWESGAGVNGGAGQNIGTAITTNTWYHIAYVKNATELRYFVNGVLQDTDVFGTNAAGGTSSSWQIGTNEAGTNPFSGYMRHLKLTASAKSDAEILAAYNLYVSDFDSDTTGALIHWAMDDGADTIIDSGPNKVHCWPSLTSQMFPRSAPLIDDGGSSLFVYATHAFSFSASGSGYGVHTEALRQIFLGAFTFECWFKIAEATLGQNAIRGLFLFGDPGTDATESTNFIGVQILADGRIQWFSEYSVGSDSIKTTTYALPDRNARYHIGIRRNAGSPTHTVDVFINGVLVETLTGVTPYTGGTTQSLRLCNGPNEVPFYGNIDDMRFSNVARTDAEILESYTRGAPSGNSVFYRMRAYDANLSRLVYWNSGICDTLGDSYGGVGPISDVVVQDIIGQANTLLIPGTGIEAMPEQWVQLNVPANQAATAMSALVSTNFTTIKAIRPGSIVGLGTRLNTPITAGTLTVTVTINGAPVTAAIVHTSGSHPSGGEFTQATGIDNYVAGDLIGIRYATDSGFLPVTADLEAWLQVVEVP